MSRSYENPDALGDPVIKVGLFFAAMKRKAKEGGAFAAPSNEAKALGKDVFSLHITRLFRVAALAMSRGFTNDAAAALTTIDMLLHLSGDDDLKEELSQRMEDYEHHLTKTVQGAAAMTERERHGFRWFGDKLASEVERIQVKK